MSVQLARQGAGLGVLGSCLFILLVSASYATSGRADPILDAPFVLSSDGCKYHCRSCGTDRHDIVVHAETNESQSAHLENCGPGSCEAHACGESLVEGELWMAARKGTASEITRLLASNPERIQYNRIRQAIQITCEAGTLIASLPLTESQALGLE